MVTGFTEVTKNEYECGVYWTGREKPSQVRVFGSESEVSTRCVWRLILQRKNKKGKVGSFVPIYRVWGFRQGSVYPLKGVVSR